MKRGRSWLIKFSAARPAGPVLIRGGIAVGEVRHGSGILSPESGNLIGQGVVRAARLESAGLKGPRLLLGEDLASRLRREGGPGDWLLRPTKLHQVWEVLWPLSTDSAGASERLQGLQFLWHHFQKGLYKVVRDPSKEGVVAHYEQALLLIARSLERIKEYRDLQRCSLPKDFYSGILTSREVRKLKNEVAGLHLNILLELQQIAWFLERG